MISWEPIIPPPARSRFFVSHRSLQRTAAAAIERVLRAAGQEVWRDRGKLHTGDNWRHEIQTAIGDCDDLVVLLTPEAAASEQVIAEVETAVRLGKRIHGFSTFDIRSSPAMYRLIQNIHVQSLPASEQQRMVGDLDGFGSYVVDTLLKAERKPHPLDLRDFERQATRNVFPPYRDIYSGGRLNRQLIQQYSEFANRLAAEPARRTPFIALNAGILLLHQRQWPQAREHLKASSQLQPSALASYFDALAILRGGRPRHLASSAADECEALARQSWEHRKSPLIALLLVMALWDSKRGRGNNLVSLFSEALNALPAVESRRDEIARFLALTPFDDEVELPYPTADIQKYLFELAGEKP